MIIQLSTILAVALGGAFGALARYGVGALSLLLLGVGFPWGTLIVNIVGSFLMGVMVTYFGVVLNPGRMLQIMLTTGFLGAFTTFSTFSLDVVTLYERGDMTVTAAYALASVILSIGALSAGMVLVRSIF